MVIGCKENKPISACLSDKLMVMRDPGKYKIVVSLLNSIFLITERKGEG